MASATPLAVRKAMVAHLKKYKVPPTAAELAAATGLAERTIREHRKRIPLGSGKDNVYQQLTGRCATGRVRAGQRVLAPGCEDSGRVAGARVCRLR